MVSIGPGQRTKGEATYGWDEAGKGDVHRGEKSEEDGGLHIG